MEKVVLLGRRQNSHRLFVNETGLYPFHEHVGLHSRLRETEAVSTLVPFDLQYAAALFGRKVLQTRVEMINAPLDSHDAREWKFNVLRREPSTSVWFC